MGSILKDVRAPQISEEGDLQYFSRKEENQREFLSLQIAHWDVHNLFILAISFYCCINVICLLLE